jgi:hypothetical protein
VVVSAAQSERPVGDLRQDKFVGRQWREIYRWSMVEDLVLLGQVLIELKNRRDIAAAR